jgi:hypothetical protein
MLKIEMVLFSHIQRRLTVLFVTLSLALWVAEIFLHVEPEDWCKSPVGTAQSARNGVDQDYAEGMIIEFSCHVVWFRLVALQIMVFCFRSSSKMVAGLLQPHPLFSTCHLSTSECLSHPPCRSAELLLTG